MMNKKFISVCGMALILTFSLSLRPVGVAVEDRSDTYSDITAGEKLEISDGNLTLWVNETNGEFAVLDNISATNWTSVPFLNGEYDEKAEGMTRTDMLSNIVISFADNQNNVSEANSLTSSVFNDGLKLQKGKNGFRLIYTFTEEGFEIPLDITLENGTLKATVNTKGIKETGENRLLTVSVCPFFGAAGPEENGYLVIPDGSGALVNFNHGVPYESKYDKSLYGVDSVLYKELDVVEEKNILMPVYGMKKEHTAFIAIAEDGDANANLFVNTSSSYTTAGFKFIYRNMDKSILNEASVRSKEVNVFSTETASCESFTVRYCFENGNDLSYLTMAQQYKSYLAENSGAVDKKSSGVALDLSYTGSAQITKSFLGIPYKGQLTLTTLDDISKVSETLKKSNVSDIVLSLKAAFSVGADGKVVNSGKLSGKIGKNKKYTELKNTINADHNDFYLIAEFQKAYKGGNGVSLNFSTARGVSGAVSEQTAFYPETYGADVTTKWYLLKAEPLKKITNKFIKSLKKYEMSVGVSGLASELYGDYSRKNNYDRQKMLTVNSEILSDLKASSDSNKLYLEESNSYGFGFADFISDIPTASSQYDVFACDVPFVQAVLHGWVDYSSEPVNLSGDGKGAVLKNIEFGSALGYELICRGEYEISESSANHLYSSSNEYWLPKAIENYKEISGFYKNIAGCNMVSHTEIAGGVVETKYSNGYSSIVNYNNSSANINGNVIEGYSYKFFKEGAPI